MDEKERGPSLFRPDRGAAAGLERRLSGQGESPMGLYAPAPLLTREPLSGLGALEMCRAAPAGVPAGVHPGSRAANRNAV